jgi:hypothetical protein
MINLQGIFERLVAFFETSPAGTRTEFEAAVVASGVATAGEVALFVDRFLDVADWMGLIAADSWDALMTKAAAVGIAKARNGARAVYDWMLLLVDFRLFELQDRLDQLQAVVAQIDVELPLIATGRAWIVANAPGTDALKAAVLKALDLGTAELSSDRAGCLLLISQLEDQIRRLGGEPA